MLASDEGVMYLVKKHPEIKKFHLGHMTYSGLSHVGLSSVLSLQCLSDLKMMGFISTFPGKVYKVISKQLQSLNLCNTGLSETNIISILEKCKGSLQSLSVTDNVTDTFLLQIVQLCGSTLKSLDIRYTNITGENLSEYNGTLPCLTDLNLGACTQLTDKGLLQILQLCGSTLKSLDISWTNLTGDNMSEYNGTLPCLTDLNLKLCKHLTDKGLLQILQLCKSTLKRLGISRLYISYSLMEKIQREYRHVELSYLD